MESGHAADGTSVCVFESSEMQAMARDNLSR